MAPSSSKLRRSDYQTINERVRGTRAVRFEGAIWRLGVFYRWSTERVLASFELSSNWNRVRPFSSEVERHDRVPFTITFPTSSGAIRSSEPNQS